MKKRIFAVLAVAGLAGAIGFAGAPSATAATCNTGPTPGAVLATNPADGGVVYSDGTTYGSSGGHGYIEAGTDGHVQGSSTDVALEGRSTAAPSLCINGSQLV